MTWTAYPFDNQDTTESQYSLLFRELQDSGVIGSYGGTDLKVTANSSAMTVTIQIGSALLRGFKVDNDAVYTVAINGAGATIRYDAIILRLDPSANSIVPVYIANAGAVPTLTKTDTGVFELLLGIVTVSPGDVTVASTAVADMRHFVRRRISISKSTNRPTSPRAYDVNIEPDLGGRQSTWDPTVNSGNGNWVYRTPMALGSGSVFPTTPGIQPGDTFYHSQMGLCIYNSAAWIPTTPYMAKMWSVLGLSGAAANGFTYNNIALTGPGRASPGFIINSTSATVNGVPPYSLQLPLDGMYSVRARSYTTGGNVTGSATTQVIRRRAGVGDSILSSVMDVKNDAGDRTTFAEDIVPLKASDLLSLSFTPNGVNLQYFGSSETNGIMLSAQYVGPLNGATPL